MQIVISVVLTAGFVGVLAFLIQDKPIPVLQPAGVISEQQYTLILVTVGLGMFVVLPVFYLLFSIAWKYREGNTKAEYDPNLHGHRGMEVLWWGIPAVIIVILAILTAISTHALDPYRPLESDKKPVEVQVVALQWRWLFIYPEYGLATMNHMVIPEQTPVNLTITADAPMNSFWVPSLAGQVYAMTGMSTKLHIMSNTTGEYDGSSANLSGDGFAHMRFKVKSVSEESFADWKTQAALSPDWLTKESYNEIALPSDETEQKTYGLVQPGIYDGVILKYMGDHKTEGSH